MLEIVRALKSIQQQLDTVVQQVLLLAPDTGDKLASTCSLLTKSPVALGDRIEVKPYKLLVPGFWLGFANRARVSVCQHLRVERRDDGDVEYDFAISTAPEFESTWLTLEFHISREDLLTKTAVAINMEVSGNCPGPVSLGVKLHGPKIEPKLFELAQYEMRAQSLTISDVILLAGAAINAPEEFNDIRFLVFLPAQPNSSFTFSKLKLSML